MKIELIICTYMRPLALCTLLDSVARQLFKPCYVTIVDGSTNADTETALSKRQYDLNIRYFRVKDTDRGLTKQRNFGISKLANDSELVSFLDDDTVLEPDYFEKITSTFHKIPAAIGVGGYIKEVDWYKGLPPDNSYRYYAADGWYRSEPSRIRIRKILGLAPPHAPCFMPEESNGRSVGSIPPTGMTYPVEYFMGGVATYRRLAFDKVHFSEYFEGYGLYEDLDFCLRLSRHGQLYLNTSATLFHYHEPSGRPNRYQYGKMVARNGWYVWRVKFENPRVIVKFKWWMIMLLLSLLRLFSAVRGPSRVQALTESIGRFAGMVSLLFSPPDVKRN